MSNLYDYLSWRGDIPFSVDPFNEVDSLILSELAYINYVSVTADFTPVSLAEACDACFKETAEDRTEAEDPDLRKAKLLKAVSREPRFRETRLCNYVNELDREQSLQFAAVTFFLEDGSAYAAFRGTDSSFIGWKESLDLSYLPETEGQNRAIEYLDSLKQIPDRALRVGGHSKGGNLAVYGSAFCRASVQERILEIYSYDGPGFHQEFLNSREYQSILPKVVSIIPEVSVIGRLLETGSDPKVVHSTASALFQHDAFTWCVQRNHFEQTEPSEIGVILQKSVEEWAETLDNETRNSLTDSIYTLLEGTGKENFRKVLREKRSTLESLMNGISELPPEKRTELIKSAVSLIRTGRQTAQSEIADLIKKNKNRHAS